MGKKNLSKRILPMALTAAMVFTSAPVMAAPNDLSGHWAEKVMTEWQEKGLIKGYEDGSVKPNNAVSRAEFVIMMNNALGLKGSGKVSFTDVKEGDWYYNAVATAVEAGYCKGYDDGTFKPGATITRAEAAIMIANAAGLAANAAGVAAFTDAEAIPAWAKGSVGAVVEAGYMSGYPDGTFGAAASIKRAEAVSSLNRVMGNKADTPVVPEEEEKTETENKKGSSGGGGGGSSSGGGSGSGGGTTPTVPTVTKTVKTSEELDAAIDADAANKNVVINVDADAALTENVDAIFNGKELTINFNDVDMAGDLEIIAHNATKIYLNDKTAGEDGTEVGVLTIDAPNAEVESYVVANTVDIIAVKYGTFHAKDTVKEKIEIKKGAVAVDEAVTTATTVTVSVEATDAVKIAGKVNEVNIETTQEVVLHAEVTTANVTAENAVVTVSEAAVVTTVNVEKEAVGATVTGEGSVETANVSAAATIDTKTVETLDVKEPVTVTVGKNAAVDTVVVSAEATDEAKTEISGSGTVAKIEATNDVTVSATKVEEVEVGSGVTAELKSDVASVTVPSTATTAPTIKVEDGVKVDTVTTEANVNVTGSGSITNVTVSGSEDVTITAPEDSAIKVESVVNTGSGNVEINNESKNEAELPSEIVVAKAVVDTVETVNIDLATSDEWRTEGYVYEFFDISFTGAEWAVEDFDWDEVTYWVNGEQFQWIPGESVVGDYAVEVDIMDYSYDAETETGHATGLIAAYEANVKAGETYKGEIRFPSSYLKVEEGYAINSGETFAVDFDVTIADSGTKLTPAKDTLEEITIDVANAADWQTEGYVYVEEYITFDGAKWSMEPYWEEHVTYWIDGEQFQWIPGESVVGDYAVEVEMVPDYDDEGNLSMKAMVFAYVENVKDGDSFDMEIKVPTYSLERTDDKHRITRDETAVIDFTVNITGPAPVAEDFSAKVTNTAIDCNVDNNAGTVTDGTITVEFAFENYTEAVRFGLMNDDGETATEKVFTREDADDTAGSVTFNMTGRPATKYEVVYQIGEEWHRTGEYIYLAIPEDAFAVTEVNGTKVDCSDNGETVESGTITVEFTFKNYVDTVVFGLMDHDNDDDVPVKVVFEKTNEDTGSVTFDMADVPVAVYEVVYYLSDVGTWVGTGTDIDLTEKEAETNIVLTKNGDQVTASWDGLGYENYTWTFEDHTGDVVELQWTKRGECVSYNMMPILPKVENGSASYDFVLYEYDTNAEDYIGKELGRLEDAIVVTADGDAVVYTMEVTDAANGVYEVTLDETPENGDLYLTEWSRGKSSYCSVYSSNGSMTFEETAFMNNGLAEGDIFDLRKASIDVTDNQLSVTMTPASETTYTVAEEPANEVNFTLNEDFTATWNGVEGYSGYRIDIGDNIIWVMDGTTKANNLLSFIPCADDDTTYDIVLKGLDESYKATELARLEDALEVTVSGSAVEYTAVFGETGVNVTWTAEGIGEIHEVRNSEGTLLSVGGGSVTPTQTINYNNNYTVANGDVLDMRVVTDASLDGQVLSVTITPASKTTYEVTE